MPTLVTLTGPIAAGKNTVADLLAAHWTGLGATVVIVDVDAVAAMVTPPGAAAAGLWFAAHQVHGAVVAEWLRSAVDVVIGVGPVYTADEQAALFGRLPPDVRPFRVLIDAPLSATWARANADASRGLSRRLAFHTAAHERFRSLRAGIAADLVVDSGELTADQIVATIVRSVGVPGAGRTGPAPG